MHVLQATFDPQLAVAKTAELLALEKSPDRLAEKLGATKELARVQKGIEPLPAKQLLAEVEKLKTFIELDRQVQSIEQKRSPWGWLGEQLASRKISDLNRRKVKLGALLEGPRWLYTHPRVWLLHAIRDYALEASHQRDAQWVKLDEQEQLFALPIVEMFERGDLSRAKAVASQLERPFAEIDAQFVLKTFEGHRPLSFDFERNVVYYFTPVRGVE